MPTRHSTRRRRQRRVAFSSPVHSFSQAALRRALRLLPVAPSCRCFADQTRHPSPVQTALSHPCSCYAGSERPCGRCRSSRGPCTPRFPLSGRFPPPPCPAALGAGTPPPAIQDSHCMFDSPRSNPSLAGAIISSLQPPLSPLAKLRTCVHLQCTQQTLLRSVFHCGCKCAARRAAPV